MTLIDRMRWEYFKYCVVRTWLLVFVASWVLWWCAR